MAFFTLRDLDCGSSGFRVMSHFPHWSRGGKAESAKEQGMDGLQERKGMCKVMCAGAVGWKVWAQSGKRDQRWRERMQRESSRGGSVILGGPRGGMQETCSNTCA